MINRILLVYNPKAGKGRFLPSLPGVIDLFTKAGYMVQAYPTQAQGDAVRLLMETEEEYKIIVPAGGDGTLDEIFTALILGGKEIPVGYIPVGSTNDYAASLGLSSNIMEAAADIISGKPCKVDAGVVNDHHVFAYVAAFGAFTDVAYETNQDMKNIFGHVAYLIEATKRLADLKSYLMHVETEDYEAEHEYIFGMVTNSISVGGIKNITGTEVLLDDGLFEVPLIHNPKNILEMQEIVGCLLTQNYDTDLIDYFKADSLNIISEQEIPWTFDGEYGGSWSSIHIENRKRSVQLILNRDRGNERPI